MVKTRVPGLALLITLMVLLCIPVLPSVLKVTLIEPSSPGFMGSLFHSGTVHPHDADTVANIKSALPVLVNLKV